MTYLQPAQLKALRFIKEHGPITNVEISELMSITVGKTRTHSRNLVSLGYARRMPNSSSASVFEITDLGKEFLKNPTPFKPALKTTDPRMAKPAQTSFHGTFYVPSPMQSVRRGADDHLKYKSLGF